jgi:hypothetical protein
MVEMQQCMVLNDLYELQIIEMVLQINLCQKFQCINLCMERYMWKYTKRMEVIMHMLQKVMKNTLITYSLKFVDVFMLPPTNFFLFP